MTENNEFEPPVCLQAPGADTQELGTLDLASYERNYQRPNFFGHRPWLYRPYIKALARKAGLMDKGRVLDLGCGQGFFTSLFAELGYQVVGVDLSQAAISSASNEYRSQLTTFEVGDVLTLPYEGTFDCVYVRSCSLYNCPDLLARQGVTEVFLSYLKRGGVLIFDHNSKLSPRRRQTTWRYHSLTDVRRHFSAFPQAESYFSLRFDTLLLGSLAFSTLVTRLASVVSFTTGVGGELVTIVHKN